MSEPIEKKPIDQGLVARVAQGMKFIVTGQAPGDWFGPGEPMQPQAPGSVAGRQFDFGFGTNIHPRPKTIETRVGFPELRGLADSLDLVRLCIETRKDQIEKLPFSIQPKKQPGELRRPRADARCAEIQRFFEMPDHENDWPSWIRTILEDLFVIDAPTLFVRRRRDDRLWGLELMDGGTIGRVLDAWGRTPRPPFPAYQQVLKGMPAANYTVPVPFGEELPEGMGELIYRPRNKRTNRIYGFSPTEQILVTINIALRSQLSTLAYFTDGNVPDALIGVPPDWDADKIKKFQTYWDALMRGDVVAKSRKMKFVPGNMQVTFTREPQLKSEFHEWIARVICYCFSLPPTAFVQQMNRATAESVKVQAQQEGLAPLMLWVKTLIDYCIRTFWGHDDIEFVWDGDKELDPVAQAQLHVAYKNAGILTVDEVRADIGRDPMPVEAVPQQMMGPDGKPMLPAPIPMAPQPATSQAPAQPQPQANPDVGQPVQTDSDLPNDGEFDGQTIARAIRLPSWADGHRRLQTWADKHRGDISWAGKFRGDADGGDDADGVG